LDQDLSGQRGPGEEITLFTRTMTIEAYKHAAIARELDAVDDGHH
jgi:hypothetical protein